MSARAHRLSLLTSLAAALLVLGVGACGRKADGASPPDTDKAGGPAPVITFEKPTHDLGVVPEGPAAKHVFKLKNTGSAPLEIKSVSASCGCTAAAPKEKIIAPGKSGEIAVTFDTRGRPGKNVKTVSVSSNDPKTPVSTLTINVEVEQLLAFQPIESFLSTTAENKAVQEAWLSGKLLGKARLKVAKVDPRGPIEVELVTRKGPTGEPQQGLRFQNAPKHAGNGTVRVVLSTGLADPTEVVHLVRWSVQGNIDAPDAVFLDLEQVGGAERVIQVRSRRPDFKLKAARVVKGPFKADLVPGAAHGSAPAAPGGALWTLKISTTLAQPPAAAATGKLVLESNDPLQPKKEMALSLEAKRGGAPAHPH